MEFPLRILHLEDEPLDSDIVRERLEQDGLRTEIDRVETLPEFTAALQRGGHALILADYTVPEVDAMEALRFTRQHHPELPFIFLSGTLGKELAVDMLKQGATDYVLKHNLARLAPAVRRALAEAQEHARRQQTEAALRESERCHRQIIESLPQLVWTCRPNGQCDYLSPQWVQYTARPAAQSLGYNWLEQLHPEDRPAAAAAWQAAATQGLPFQTEFRIRRHDGAYRWFRTLALPLRDPSGCIVKWFGTNTDIDDLKQTEAQLQRQAHLIDLSPTATIVRTLEGRITFWSAGAQSLYGWTAEEAIGRRTHDLFQTQFPKPLPDIVADLRRNGHWSGELRHRAKDGHTVIVESHWLGQFAPDGQVIELLESNVDITDRKQAELDLAATRDRLAAELHAMNRLHDLSTRFLQQEDLHAVLDALLETALNTVGAPMGHVHLLDPVTGELPIAAHRGLDEAFLDYFSHVKPGQIACGTAIQSSQCVVVEDVKQSPLFLADPAALELKLASRIRAMICTPLVAHAGQAVGVLSLDFHEPHRPSDRDLRSLDLLARLAADFIRRKQAEQALQAAKERIETILASITDCFFALDRELHFTYANPEAQRVLHKTSTELLGGYLPDVFPHAEAFQAQYERVLSTAKPAHFEEFYAPMQIWFEVHAYPSPEGISVYFRDVTERRRAEEALRRQTLHLQLLHQAAARLLVGQQPVELLRDLQPQIAQALGADAFMLYQADRANGHGPDRLHLRACAGVTEEQKQKLETLRYGRAICAHPAEALQPIIATEIQTRQAPNRRFVRKLGFRSYLYYPLILNHHLHGTVAFASRSRDDYDRIDLDFFQTIAGTLAEAMERERLEKELARHAAELESTVQERTAKLRETIADLEGFSYSLIHDLRAPLRAMQAYACFLEEDAGPRLQPQETDLLRKLKLASDRMDHLITDSFNYSRILREAPALAPVNLGSLLRGLVETYPNLQPPGATITLELGDLLVTGNEAVLTQVFSNLLSNAVKFVAPGVHPRARVWSRPSTLNHQPSTTHVLVWVEDNGIGIPKEAQEKIFGMFQRLHRESEYPGTGIGLAIVKKSLERIGGQICLESEPGQGSRFCVQLPLASAAGRD